MLWTERVFSDAYQQRNTSAWKATNSSVELVKESPSPPWITSANMVPKMLTATTASQ